MLDFMLSATRDAKAAERFFRAVLGARHTTTPRMITTEKHAAYPPAGAALQPDGTLSATWTWRQCKYLNTVVDQEHRLVQRRVNPGMGCGTFPPAQRTIQGYAAMPMCRKGPRQGPGRGDVLAQHRVINQLGGLVA